MMELVGDAPMCPRCGNICIRSIGIGWWECLNCQHRSRREMAGKDHSKQILLDFDGVLHDYQGWKSADVIDGGMIEGAAEFMNARYEEGYSLAIFSARFADDIPKTMQSKVRVAICRFLSEHGVNDGVIGDLEFVSKPPACIYIDDRGFRFEGKFPTAEDLAKRPWNRK